jgi:hypothetical protein
VHTPVHTWKESGDRVPLIDMDELEESAAEQIVAELGAVRWERRDTGKLGIQIRDFDVLFADGHEEPLEVTTSADPLVLNTMARMDGTNRVAASVSRSWIVRAPYTWTDASNARRPFDRRRCIELLVPFIEQLDRRGPGTVRHDDARLRVSQPPPERRARTIRARDPARLVARVFPRRGRTGDRTRCGRWRDLRRNDRHASPRSSRERQGNQAKLAERSEVTRRHLFVVLTSASETLEYVALLGVLDGLLEPPPIPTLPEAITTIWAGTAGRGIYATPPEGWETFGRVLDDA